MPYVIIVSIFFIFFIFGTLLLFPSFKLLAISNLAKKEIYIFYHWKNIKKLLKTAIWFFVFITLFLLFLIGSLIYFSLNSSFEKIKSFFKQESYFEGILIWLLVSISIIFSFCFFNYIYRFVSFKFIMKKYKKEHKWFEKSFDDILNFDDKKYPFPLFSLNFYFKYSRYIWGINNIVRGFKIKKFFCTKKYFLKSGILKIIEISFSNYNIKFESEVDQYNFIMKKLILLFEKRFNYSIEYIKQKYNELLNIK